MALCYFRPRESAHDARVLGWVDRVAGSVAALEGTLDELLRLDAAERSERIAALRREATVQFGMADVVLLAPVERQEVWAAGVTYERSRDARMEESTQEDVYERVYDAARPEIFYKASAERCVGPFEAVAIRADSAWNVPEPELALVIDAHGEIAGCTIGNDVSSRSIEGENPLYLPQAKVYTHSCALGPWIVPADDIAPGDLGIHLRIERDGADLWTGATSTRRLHRSFDELVGCLYGALEFPSGAILMTGTGIVPPSDITLEAGDIVTIVIENIGSLTNHVYRLSVPREGATP